MVVAYRDLSGNNPTHHLLDKPTLRSAPAVEFGAIIDPSSVNQEFPKMARAVYITSAAGSALSLVDQRGNATTFTGLAVGQILDVQASGTTSASTVDGVIPLY